MKINAKVLAGVGAVLSAAGIAAPAAAAYQEPWNITGAETFTVRLAGATAQDKGIILLMRRLCQNNSMVRVAHSTHTVIACLSGADAAAGTPSIPLNTKLVLYKNSGGSGSGVNPVADGTTVPFVNVASLAQADYETSTKCSVTTIASTTDFADYKNYACGANIGLSNVKPDAGISDVEPSLLGYVSGVNGAIVTTPGPLLTFGIPVSKNFRDALQAAQATSLPGCVGSDTEACIPSLSKAQVASLFAGGFASRAGLSGENGNTLGVGAIAVCRRKVGSGTLAGTLAYFLNAGCVKNSQAVKTILDGTDGNTGPSNAPVYVSGRVAEYGATGAVIGCLNANHANNRYAIGMAGIEFAPGGAYSGVTAAAPFDSDTGNWRWIRINGQSPSLLNTAQGRYDFAFELSYQTRAGSNPNGALNADQKALYDKVVATNSASVVIKELNAAFVQGGWSAGLLAAANGTATLPSAAPAGPLTAAEVEANPVSAWGRAAAQGSPNSCQPAYIIQETGIDGLL